MKEFEVSRWSDEFNKHPIHQLLDEADECIAVEVDDTDAEFEGERRRLKNVLGTLRAVVAGLDPDFYPKQSLDQIHQHFKGHVLNQLKAFSEQKSIVQLRTANDNATSYAPQIFNIAAMSRPQEAQQAVANAQDAFTSFSASMEAEAKETSQRLSTNEAELAAVSEKAAALDQKLSRLDASAIEKLAEWQDEFTEKQTTRAEEHSAAQIEREKKFSENLKAQIELFEQGRLDAIAKQMALFDTSFEDFKKSAEIARREIKGNQVAIRQLHDLVTDETVTGGYHKSSKDEGRAANFWRFASIVCLLATAIWLAYKVNHGFEALENGGVNWPDLITASSLTAIFLYAAGYTSRQSKMHRDNETLLRSYALETQALDPFIASLSSKEQQAIKAELVRRMFGQQNANGSTESAKLDDGTLKTLVDKVSDTLSEAVSKVVDKG
ncbi:hypothetical protein [Pseudooceanicola sp. 200-1SW]|uniref:hypothetical protein n=1 Tax=Pseudooceanicola sp. 200-1SW TaxID=3425949 RepID=UPI003D7F4BDE